LDSAYYSAYANTPGYYYGQGYPYIGSAATNGTSTAANSAATAHHNSATAAATAAAASNLAIPNATATPNVNPTYPVSMPSNPIVDGESCYAN